MTTVTEMVREKLMRSARRPLPVRVGGEADRKTRSGMDSPSAIISAVGRLTISEAPRSGLVVAAAQFTVSKYCRKNADTAEKGGHASNFLWNHIAALLHSDEAWCSAFVGGLQVGTDQG
jgi:hypothetical protein